MTTFCFIIQVFLSYGSPRLSPLNFTLYAKAVGLCNLSTPSAYVCQFLQKRKTNRPNDPTSNHATTNL